VSALTAKSRLRVAAAAVTAAVVWVVAHYTWPWLAAVVAFVLLTTMGVLISDKVPTVLERISGSEPLVTTVGADIGFYSDGWALVLPNDINSQSTPPRGIEHLQARNYLFEAGAFDLRESYLLLTLEGRSLEPVRVTGLRSRVLSRAEALSGAVVSSPSAGEQKIVAAHFNLDDDEAPARSDDGHEYFRDYSLTLGRGESFMYRIIARVERSSCEWVLLLNYSHRNAHHELVIDSAGTAFRTAARTEEVAAFYNWAWYEQPAGLVQAPASDLREPD
jgi:hypothetical protein